MKYFVLLLGVVLTSSVFGQIDLPTPTPAPNNPKLSVSPVGLNFSSTNTNGNITVSNSGVGTLEGISASLSNTTYFSITNNSCRSLTTGTCSITIRFTVPNDTTSHQAILNITSSNGGSQSVTLMGTGTNKPPSPAFTVTPAQGQVPLRVNLDATGSTDDGTIVGYTWSTSTGETASGSKTSLTFNKVGTHTITLIVIDDKGLKAQSNKTVIVKQVSTNKPPVASFTVTPNQGQVPLKVNLNASASKDEDGTITKYSWSTSNGQTAVGSTASLTFNQAGSHTITLTVTDDKGLTAQTRKTVTVNSPTQASQEATAYLINLSTRAPIEGGSGDVIAGFIITGAGKQKVLIRAFSIEAGVDPKLTVQKYPSGDMVASNDDWQDDPNIASKIKALPVHLRLTNDLDAGLLLELPAGAYTAILSSVGAKGIGLIGVDAID